jgi:hypothetical protein
LSTSATPWKFRATVRKHLQGVPIEDLEESVRLYRDEVGPMHPRPYTAGAYDFVVTDALKEVEELSTDEIGSIISSYSGNSYSNAVIGGMLGQMKARGRLTQRTISQKGRRIALWKLFVKM